MYNDILVPTDGSDGFENVTEHAIEIADKFDATIHVVNVIDTGVMRYDIEASEFIEELHQYGEKTTQEVAEQAEKEGIPVLEEVVEGLPYEEILNYADEKDVDMIIMGTHGRTGLGRVVLGSVAEKVLRKSEVPVLTTGLEQGDS